MIVQHIAQRSRAHLAVRDLIRSSSDNSFSLNELATSLGVDRFAARDIWDQLLERGVIVQFDDYFGEPSGDERCGLCIHQLTLGASYEVLSVERGHYRLFNDVAGHGPVLFHTSLFEVADAAAPDSWVTAIDEDGGVCRGPRAWLRPGFFEDVHDGLDPAVSRFRQELRRAYPVTYQRVKDSW